MIRKFVAKLYRKFVPKRPPKRLGRIEFYDHSGALRVGAIVGPVGFYLDVRPSGGTGISAQLISAQEAVDQDQFWDQWRAWGGDQLFYEDGRKFEL